MGGHLSWLRGARPVGTAQTSGKPPNHLGAKGCGLLCCRPNAHVGSELSWWWQRRGSDTQGHTGPTRSHGQGRAASQGQPGRKLSGGSCDFQIIQRWPLRGPGAAAPQWQRAPQHPDLAPNTTLPGKEPGSSGRWLVRGGGGEPGTQDVSDSDGDMSVPTWAS